MSLLQIYDVSCAKSVTEANAIEVATVPAGLYAVTAVSIWIPDGHAGLTGIALGYGHNPVIPMAGDFLSANDEVFNFTLGDDYPNGVAWSVFVCNLDLQSHSWQTRWTLDIAPVTSTTPASTSLSADAIYAAAANVSVGS